MGTMLILVLVLALAGCVPIPEDEATEVITVWAHAGRESERRTLEAQIRAFEKANPGLAVDVTFIPEGSYNGQVQAAALAGRLPDLLELDGPYLAAYAWRGWLAPLDEHLPDTLKDDLLPSLLEQGQWRGQWYGVGMFDSGLGLWADRRALKAVEARIPEGPADAWTLEEFQKILSRLAASTGGGPVLDLKLNYGTEWFTYAFSPLLQSAGAGVMAEDDEPQARGHLDAPASVQVLETVQGWFQAGWVDPNLDDAAFTSGRVPLAWGGHWNAPAYRDALGEDLILLPLPRAGDRLVSGQGSWQWALSSRARHPEQAAKLLAFLLETEQVLKMSRANGAVPATLTAIAASEDYGPEGALRLFAEQLRDGYTRPRPRTPAYPVVTDAFARAFRDIRHGAPVADTLEAAARRIDREVEANHGYPDN
ncbi:sugar ABC transporter substrate-binding protein [Ectothiorhodospira haloalkaliphila]|uniref:ABC transporter substrate-binding protein n=1 Tax=Ectothiorhodospira haloalkaliphila TaxID=421628 RepID=UPI001EE847AC|nr:sugar ABC transporter substrate-binding protein [Ectothiorhodospira haloalkaliphila]MCG5526209.1 sugar ABC transporter substrate-binding protein [Ectothiorhodospira haloalkaliphila]